MKGIGHKASKWQQGMWSVPQRQQGPPGKINDCPRAGETQYGYVFFDISVRTPGPVRRVDKVNLEFLLLYIRSFCKFHLKHRAAVACCRLANTIILEPFVIVLFYRCPVLWWWKRWTTTTYTSLSLLLILISTLPETWKLVARLTTMKGFILSVYFFVIFIFIFNICGIIRTIQHKT